MDTPTHVFLILTFNFCRIEDKEIDQSMIYSFNKSYLKQWDHLHPEYSIYGVSFFDLQGNFVRNVNFDWELFTHINYIDSTYDSRRLFADWLYERSSENCTADPNLISAVKYQNLVERAALGAAVHGHLTHIRSSNSYFGKSVKEYVETITLATHARRFNQDPATWHAYEPHCEHM